VRRRSYPFHRDGRITWSLVFDRVSGRWHIEKARLDGARVRLTLFEFETSEHGRQLSQPLAEAVREAEADDQ
jgi:hypothetical protein